ncbi:MAG: transposase [Candidatus Bathyarchaeia archaeon]
MHICVDESSMPLSIALRPGNEHDSKRFNELLEGLDKAPKIRY